MDARSGRPRLSSCGVVLELRQMGFIGEVSHWEPDLKGKFLIPGPFFLSALFPDCREAGSFPESPRQDVSALPLAQNSHL